MPFAFGLMSGQSENGYTHLLQYVDQNIMSLKCNSFMTDYERALRNALITVSPDAKVTSCWFHFCQACKRNAYKLGMKTILETNENARTSYYELLALPLLPANQIMDAFQKIELRTTAQQVPRFKPFLKYYHRQWLIRVNK